MFRQRVPDKTRSDTTLRMPSLNIPGVGTVWASLLQERESAELARDRTTQAAGQLLDNDGGERDVRMYKR